MNPYRPIVCAAAILFSSLTGAFADPILSGSIVGIFQSDNGAHSSVTNFSDGSASFRSGVATAGSFQSGVNFTASSFSNAVSGDVVSAGLFTYYNGITKSGTTSGDAMLDLYLQTTDPLASWVHLTTLNFAIDATANTGSSLVPDQFTVSYTQPDEFLLGKDWVKLVLGGISSVTSVAENSHLDVGALTLTIMSPVAVADGGASLLLLALGLLALAGYRGMQLKVRLS